MSYKTVVSELEVGIVKDMSKHAFMTELFTEWHKFKCYASDYIDMYGKGCDLNVPVENWFKNNGVPCATSSTMYTYCRRYALHREQVLYKVRTWARRKVAPYKERLPIGAPFKGWWIQDGMLFVSGIGTFVLKNYEKRVSVMGPGAEIIEAFIIRRGTRCCLRIVYRRRVRDVGGLGTYSLPVYTDAQGAIETLGNTPPDASLRATHEALVRAIRVKVKTAATNPYKQRRLLKVQRRRHAVKAATKSAIKRTLAVMCGSNAPKELVYVCVGAADARGIPARLSRYYDHVTRVAAMERAAACGVPFRTVYWKNAKSVFAHECDLPKCQISHDTRVPGDYVSTCAKRFPKRQMKVSIARVAENAPLSKSAR
jgi:hypothetical protein